MSRPAQHRLNPPFEGCADLISHHTVTMKKDLLGWTFMTRPWNKKIAKQERLTEEVINRLVKERYPFRTDADYASPALIKRVYYARDLQKLRWRQDCATSWQHIVNY